MKYDNTNKALAKHGAGLSLKNKWLKLEDIIYGQNYAFTFNPLEQPASNGKLNLYKFYREQYNWLKEVAEQNDVELTLWYEQSPSARSHFHGNIKVNDLTKFGEFIRRVEFIASTEMDTIGDIQVWYTYCTKQMAIWNVFYERHVISHPMVITRKQPPAPLKGGEKDPEEYFSD
jgi:hypothetical protein